MANGGMVLPGSALGLGPELLGPTGNVYFHPDGKAFSTELNFVADHPSGKGYTYMPLLVPGQTGIDDLLAGKKPTPEQYEIARKYAAMTNALGRPSYATAEEAVAAEKPLCSRITRAVALAEEHAEERNGVGDPARTRYLRMIRKRLMEARRDAHVLLIHLDERKAEWDKRT